MPRDKKSMETARFGKMDRKKKSSRGKQSGPFKSPVVIGLLGLLVVLVGVAIGTALRGTQKHATGVKITHRFGVKENPPDTTAATTTVASSEKTVKVQDNSSQPSPLANPKQQKKPRIKINPVTATSSLEKALAANKSKNVNPLQPDTTKTPETDQVPATETETPEVSESESVDESTEPIPADTLQQAENLDDVTAADPEQQAQSLYDLGRNSVKQKEWEEAGASFNDLLKRYRDTQVAKENKKDIESNLKLCQKYLGEFEIADEELLGSGYKKMGNSLYRLVYRFEEKSLKTELVAWSNVYKPWEDGVVGQDRSPAKVVEGSLEVKAASNAKYAWLNVPFAGRNISVSCRAWTVDTEAVEPIIIALCKANSLSNGYYVMLNMTFYQGESKLYHSIAISKGDDVKYPREVNYPIIKPGQKVWIQVEVNDDEVSLSVDEKRVIYIKDRKNTEAFVDWVVAFGTSKSEVAFDDIVINGCITQTTLEREKNDIRASWRLKGQFDRENAMYEEYLKSSDKLFSRLNSSNEKVLDIALEAMRAMLAGRYDQALRSCSEALKADPNCGFVYYLRAQCYLAKNDMDKALQDAQAAVRIQSDFTEAYRLMGKIYNWKFQPKEAIAILEKALAIDKDQSDVYLELAKAHYYDRNIDKAVEVLQKAPQDGMVKKYLKSMQLNKTGPQWKKKYIRETKHYSVLSNVSQPFADEIAQHAELAFNAYSHHFPTDRLKNSPKSRIIVFESQLQFMEYNYLTTDHMFENAAGIYSPIMKELVLFDSNDKEDTIDTLYHEGFHQFLDLCLSVQDVPICFNEGMAEYFGASRIQGGQLTTGLVNRYRLQTIQRAVEDGNFIPLKDVFTYTQGQYYQNAHLCYAEGWSLMHFLIHAGGEGYRPLLRNYFKALFNGKSQDEPFQEGFGKVNWKNLTQEWKRYVKSLK